MKLIQIDTNYYKFPEGIKTIEEFIAITNKCGEKFIKMVIYSQEHCREPYFIEDNKKIIYINLS